MKLKLTFILLWLVLTVEAQTTLKFSEGLVATQSHHYGREAIVYDPLALKLISNQLGTPQAGQSIFTNLEGEEVKWESITADSVGNFRGRELSNAYLYLSYEADEAQNALMHIAGHYMFYLNGKPYGGDNYSDNWLYVPVKLEKGLNEIMIRTSRWGGWRGIMPELVFPEKEIFINSTDATLPHVVVGKSKESLWGAIVVINTTEKALDKLTITATLEGKSQTTELPAITSMNFRKVGFQFNPEGVNTKKNYECMVQLKNGNKVLDEQTITIEAVNPEDHQTFTFISDIDGSVQYYGVAPQQNPDGTDPALFLSVHGAGVEAIGQARAYAPKDWGVLVTPTNRRPRGFNWEDWGRLDAMEVFEIAKEKYKPDPKRIYLTGHSMGGHGTWYLGATFPGKWAAIAPCAGYPTLNAYGSSDGIVPEEGQSDTENLLLRSSNPSNVLELAKNYQAGGVYIHHGDSDRVVPVTYARQMRDVLADFHPDFSYYEYPGGSHWFGNESVDWAPIFDYFKWHTIEEDSTVDLINYTTANSSVSSNYKWTTILQQEKALEYSRLDLKRDRQAKTIKGTTENVAYLQLDIDNFSVGDTISIYLDDTKAITQVVTADKSPLVLQHQQGWAIGEAPDTSDKGIVRNGTFKEPFNHNMVFVYSTKGKKDENDWSYAKARFDAQVWYYRANGAVDIVADKDFNPANYPERGVVIYGNASTNAAWKKLLADSPIQLKRGAAQIGGSTYESDEIGAYFMRPRQDSEIAAIAVVGGTGLTGMKSTEANQYFAGGSGFPDYMIYKADMLEKGDEGIMEVGFYGNDWTINDDDRIVKK